jgi:hypothetical protein
MRKDRFDISETDADRNRTSSIQRAPFSELDEALPIKLWKAKMPKSFVKEG